MGVGFIGRWYTIKLVNSEAMSTVEASIDPPTMVPRPPVPGVPIAGLAVKELSCNNNNPYNQNNNIGFRVVRPLALRNAPEHLQNQPASSGKMAAKCEFRKKKKKKKKKKKNYQYLNRHIN